MQEIVPELQNLGATLVALTPQLQSHSKALVEKHQLPHETFPGYEGAFMAIKAPEGTVLFAFDEDFLGDTYEVEESDDASEFPGLT